MARLLVFNPDHDFSLACWNSNYTAPAAVRKLAASLQWLPLLWSKEQDFILLADNSIVQASENSCVGLIPEDFTSVEPWGWDPAIWRRVVSLGLSTSLLPTLSQMESLRRLSHRRISIDCNRYLGSQVIPCEFTSASDALAFFKIHRGCYFKMPWSSGGRGVLATRELTSRQVEEWIRGCIRRQGSVLAEMCVNRVLDFATLWEILEDDIIFEGFSVSLSDGRGKYDGNLYGSQKDLETLILKMAPTFQFSIVENQKSFIKSRIAPYYNGKLGIDMMVDRNGVIFPCVEINLRRTMGHVAMDFYKLFKYEETDDHWKRKCGNPPLVSFQEYIACHPDC